MWTNAAESPSWKEKVVKEATLKRTSSWAERVFDGAQLYPPVSSFSLKGTGCRREQEIEGASFCCGRVVGGDAIFTRTRRRREQIVPAFGPVLRGANSCCFYRGRVVEEHESLKGRSC